MHLSTIQLRYLGEGEWWEQYLSGTEKWKMSRRLQELLDHDVGP